MSNFSSSYQERRGIQPMTWEQLYALCKGLAQAIAPYKPDIVLGIARGGLYPATLISQFLQTEFYPIRLTRRVNDVMQHAQPQWRTRPPDAVRGQTVLIVDEMCGSGETLSLAKDEALRLGAREVRLAALCAHESGRATPDYIGMVTDELVLNPWDREILKDGEYVFHPEYVHALGLQGIAAEPSLLLGIEAVAPAKA